MTGVAYVWRGTRDAETSASLALPVKIVSTVHIASGRTAEIVRRWLQCYMMPRQGAIALIVINLARGRGNTTIDCRKY